MNPGPEQEGLGLRCPECLGKGSHKMSCSHKVLSVQRIEGHEPDTTEVQVALTYPELERLLQAALDAGHRRGVTGSREGIVHVHRLEEGRTGWIEVRDKEEENSAEAD